VFLNNDRMGEMPSSCSRILVATFGGHWVCMRDLKKSSVGWNLNMKGGGKLLLPKLNMCETPIVNKYFEGKLKNTLVRG